MMILRTVLEIIFILQLALYSLLIAYEAKITAANNQEKTFQNAIAHPSSDTKNTSNNDMETMAPPSPTPKPFTQAALTTKGSTPDKNEMGELWVVETKFQTSFLDNKKSSDYSNHSYKNVTLIETPFPQGITIRDSMQSPVNPNVYIFTGVNENGTKFAYAINIEEGAFSKLFSSIDYPDFKRASIGSGGISSDHSAIHFIVSSCENCGGMTISNIVYNIKTNEYENIGNVTKFRWTGGYGGYEYKLSPKGCEEYFNTPFKATENTVCETKLSEADWILGS